MFFHVFLICEISQTFYFWERGVLIFLIICNKCFILFIDGFFLYLCLTAKLKDFQKLLMSINIAVKQRILFFSLFTHYYIFSPLVCVAPN